VIFASDWIFAGYNLLLALLWLPWLRSPGYARWIIAAHLAAATLPPLLRRRPLTGWMTVLRDLYPIAWIAAFWSEVDLHSGLIDTTANDALIARLDHAMFGVTLHQAWVARMPWDWLNALMQSGYFAYYLLIVGVPLLVLTQRNRLATRELVLRLTLAFLVCFACYAIFPVNGPDGTFPVALERLTHNPIYQLNLWMRSGDSLGSSFPSSHVAASVAFAWVAWHRCRRWQAVTATIIAALVCFATVYTENHFAIDSVVGLVLGVGLQLSVRAGTLRSTSS
jgi:membrane-associated phospholipid phosphatase